LRFKYNIKQPAGKRAHLQTHEILNKK